MLIRCLTLVVVAGLLLAACGTPTPTGTPPTTTPSGATPTPGPSPTPGPPTATATASPSPTPAPLELVVCQVGEPDSLYLYAGETRSRAGIFQALFDGPVDTLGYAYQPVILDGLPDVNAGTAGLAEVEVAAGDRVVDAATGAVVPLGDGVTLAAPGGGTFVYSGSQPARTIQVWAEFHLRAGVVWSDGQPVTAADSRFSYEMAASPASPVSKFVVDRTASYEALDDLRLRWAGLPGWQDSGYAQRFWTPLPLHALGSLDAAALLADPGVSERPLGWGPFVVGPEGWIKGHHLTLVRNPRYFRAAEGLPYLDRVTFRFGLEVDGILADLESGGCDVAGDDVDLSAHTAALLQAQASGRLQVQAVPDSAFEHLDFGIVPASSYRRAAGNDLFQDVRVRQAVAHCLDRQALINQLLNGLSEVPAVYVPADHPAFEAAAARYAFDPPQGRSLLEQAGWLDLDGDGVRERGQRRLAVTLVSGPAESEFRQQLLSAISAQLREHCGIEAEPVFEPVETLYDIWPDGVLFGRRFDLGAFPWRTGLTPPCDLYLTGAIPSGENPGGTNNTGYSNPDFDQACQTALGALDEAARLAAHQQAQVIFAADLPSLPLFFRPKLAAARPLVAGLRLDSTAASLLWNIEALTLNR
jgi:peptide/nickel transport system substrate-binding protein